MNRNSIRRDLARYVFLLATSILFITANCKKAEVLEAKQDTVSGENKTLPESAPVFSDYAYVINPNGIGLYQTTLDLKSKIGDIPYGGKITFTYETVNSESEEVNNWSSVSFNDKKGFVYSIEPYAGKDWITLNPIKAYEENSNKEEDAYSIVQASKAIFYELPSVDSKQIEAIDQFTLVQVAASGHSYDSFISNNIDLEMGGSERTWYEVTANGKKGFLFNSINYPVIKSIAETQAKDKYLSEKGYFLLTSKAPVLYNSETKEPFGKEYNIKVLKENHFFDSTESRLINGEQVYLIILGEKLDIKLKKKPKKIEDELFSYNAYISAKDGNYFGEQKFSDYTVANTKFKGDLNAITIVRNEFEKRGIYLNYSNFSLKKISNGKYPQESYLIASAYVGYYARNFNDNGTGSVRSIILRQTDGVYEPVSGSIYTSNPIRFKDLDTDGVMEMIVKVPNRGGDETVIYGLQEGRYVSLNKILNEQGIYELEIKGNKVRGKKWISSDDGKTTKEEIHMFKYEKGSFVAVKI